MNRKEHQNFAKLVAQKTLEEELQSKNLPWNILCDIAVEWIGNNIGVLPDKLEPATNMYHRNLFHSADAYRLIDNVIDEIRKDTKREWWVNVTLITGLRAYQSHIILDSKTTMSVPDYQWVWELLKLFQKRNES